MGKKSATSWLTAVKRAFRSPTKDSEKKSSRRKVDHAQQDEEEKKTERRRWLFRKQSTSNAQQSEPTAPKTPDHRHAIATAVEVEIIRLAQPSRSNAASFKHHSAARVIQTAFRGYLARRALIALKGIVKLQALIRGQNVRKQANMTMRCMQSLLRVQARVRDQRARLSHDGGGRRSMFAETTNLWESKYQNKINQRGEEETEVENRGNWHDKWMARESYSRRDSIKTVEIDSLRTSSNGRKSRCQSPIHRQAVASPRHRSLYSVSTVQSPSTPSLISKNRSTPRCLKEEKSYSTANTPNLRATQRINSSISRYSTSTNEGTPNSSSIPNYMAATESAKARIRSQSAPRQRPSTPERERGGSTAAATAKKRLSYPIPEPYCVNFGFGCNSFSQNLRSPSFKSVQAGYVGMEEQSNYSCYTESIGGEISPCSTTDLRRWLR